MTCANWSLFFLLKIIQLLLYLDVEKLERIILISSLGKDINITLKKYDKVNNKSSINCHKLFILKRSKFNSYNSELL